MDFANLFKRCPGLAVWIDELAFVFTDIATRGRLLAWRILSTACRANESSEHKTIVSPIPGLIQKLFEALRFGGRDACRPLCSLAKPIHMGMLFFFERGTVHAIPDILAGPLIFLSIDTPRRDPKDVIFVNPGDGTPESFIQGTNEEGAVTP